MSTNSFIFRKINSFDMLKTEEGNMKEKKLKELLLRLKPRWRLTLFHYYGLCGYEKLEQKEIHKRLIDEQFENKSLKLRRYYSFRLKAFKCLKRICEQENIDIKTLTKNKLFLEGYNGNLDHIESKKIDMEQQIYSFIEKGYSQEKILNTMEISASTFRRHFNKMVILSKELPDEEFKEKWQQLLNKQG